MQLQCMTLVALLTLCCSQVSARNSPESSYYLTYIRMCLRSQFLQNPATIPENNERICASACNDQDTRCQGFWMPGGRCQLFVFDQCSHLTVAVANCTQFVWAYVRKQANLPPGQLCPAGYANGYFGSTYKAISVSNWADAQSKCSAEDGLAKFADGMDRGETMQMHWIKTNVLSGSPYYIGGYQISAGTWVWQACNVAFLPEVWEPYQPNGGPTQDRANIWSAHTVGVDDDYGTIGSISKALCECINPFV